jgi:ATP-dependent Lhr-like helicase
MSLLPRTDLKDWLAVQPADNNAELSGAAKRVLGVLEQRGAAFFDDIVDRCGIMKSQCEQALGELAAGGYVTSDSYEGLRVLLIAPSRRRPLNGARRRNVSISSIDSAGRWDLIARQASGDRNDPLGPDSEELDCIVRTLLRRYGIVFKIALERESALPQWRYILWSLRRLEARGEIRGGRFIAGFSGEQFALPDALEALRRTNKRAAEKELVAVSACDPLNLVGIVTPGLRIAATLRNRIIYLDGEPLAVRLGTEIHMLKACDQDIEIRVRTLLIERASRARAQRRAHR